jgi:aminoglycoside phosphotransferase (APT) family kinase protein
VICHGDLHVRHLLVDRDGSVTGVIDWGDLCLADPAVDLSIAYFAFAGRARADLLSAYGRTVSASANWQPGAARYPWQLASRNTQSTRGGLSCCGNAWPG